MNKFSLFIVLSLLLMACEKKSIVNNPESSLVNIQYPTGTGHSGDTLTNVLGYGYDATGLCDTIAVKAKVLNLSGKGNLLVNNCNSSSPVTIISGINLPAMFSNIQESEGVTIKSEFSFESHVKSLLKLASKSDSIYYNCIYAYYSFNILKSFIIYQFNSSAIESEITPEFADDLNALTAEQLVKKYGTHVLTSIYTGAKFEVLYKCNNSTYDASEIEQSFYTRMEEFFNEIPGIWAHYGSKNHAQNNEQLIYNSLGSKVKLSGLINATDNNSKGILVDVASMFQDNLKYQFISVGEDGLIPLYEFVSDSGKKQAIQNYIDQYLSEQKE